MKRKILRSLVLGFFLVFFLILLAIFVVNAGGLTQETSTPGNMLFGILIWNVLLAIYLVKIGLLPVFGEYSFLFALIYAFAFGWAVYSAIIFCAMHLFGRNKKALDHP